MVAMHICRTILALLVALSVATLPIAGLMTASAAPVSQPAQMATQDMVQSGLGQSELSASAMDGDMHDCCPHPKNAPCGMPVDQCPAYSCAQSVAFSPVPAVHVKHPLVPRAKLTALSDRGFHPQPSSPPLRPPRI
jgi:hypothetical protein